MFFYLKNSENFVEDNCEKNWKCIFQTWYKFKKLICVCVCVCKRAISVDMTVQLAACQPQPKADTEKEKLSLNSEVSALTLRD